MKAYDRRSGEELGKETYISTPMGREEWFRFPKDERTQKLLKEKGIEDLPIKLKVGEHRGEGGFGYMHVLNHAGDFAELGESPLKYLYNTLRRLDGMKQEGGQRYRLRTKERAILERGEITGKEERLIYIDLIKEEGCYSIVTSYPRKKSIYSKTSNERELIIGGAVFRFTASNQQGNFRGIPGTEEVLQSLTHEQFAEAPREKVAEKGRVVNIYDVEVRGKGKNGEEVRYVQRGEEGANFGVIRGGIEEEVREEMRKIREEAERKGEYMKAPNGEASKLSEEQWCMVRTRGFKRWFGDWESMGYKKYFRERLVRLLREEAVEKARGAEYEEIKGMGFDKRVLPVAYIPVEIAELMGGM